MAAEKRPIKVDDFARMLHVEDPQISPDGRWIAYVQVAVDMAENGYKRHIWLVSTEGGQPLQLTRGGRDMQPRWSPDGSMLAFVSMRNKRPQVFLLRMTAPGGEARQLTTVANGASSPEWSPGGEWIAFTSALNAEERAREDEGQEEPPPRDMLEGKHREERKEEDEKNRWDPRPIWRIPYRAETSFLDDRYQQIYVQRTAEGLEGDEAKARRLTSVDAHHEPARWSSDGRYLFTSRAAEPDRDEPWLSQTVYRIMVETGEAEQLSENGYMSYAARVSPDGRWLAYFRQPADAIDVPQQLVVLPLEGGALRDIAGRLDRSAGDAGWTQDGRLVFMLLADGVSQMHVYDPAADSNSLLLDGPRQITAMGVGADGALALAVTTPANPGELYYRAAGGGDLRQMTELNHKFLDEVLVQEIHEMRFQSPAGMEIQGWYMLPVGYEEGKQYPLALNIHGGPRVMWHLCERTMWHEWQLHAAEGYVVFYCNPRGGDGYGTDHLRALRARWGDVAMDDIMAGVDAMIAKGFVDADRLAITGGSYGGYMTAWIVGHTDRFKAAVSQRGVYNLVSFYGTSDIPFLVSHDFEVEPWENQPLLWEHSPLAYAHNIKTPLLIIHAENDYRVPIEQAEQLFAQVRRSGGTVHMLRYPRDGHEMSRSGEPKHRLSRLKEMVNWWDKYCQPDKKADEAAAEDAG